MDERLFMLEESEALYLEAKSADIDDEQRIQLMIELLRQIDMLKQQGLDVTIDVRSEFLSTYEQIKTSELRQAHALQLRLEILRYLSLT